MAVPVTRNFVTGFTDTADQRPRPLAYPAEDEECRLDASRFEQAQEPISVRLEAPLHASPVIACDRSRERRDMEVILHIDSHGIQFACCPYAFRARHLHHALNPNLSQTLFSV